MLTAMGHRFSRQELYDLVWSEPLSQLAPRLQISNVGLAKACRRAAIPVPERGYWAKLKAGKRVVRHPLPLRRPGMLDEIVTGADAARRYGYVTDDEIRNRTSDPPVFPEDMADLTARVRRMVGRVRISKTLSEPHPIIAELLAADERRRERQRNAVYPSPLNDPLFDSPFERRRLRILNAICVALARSGAGVAVGGPEARQLDLRVGHQGFSFTLDRIETPRRQCRQERLKLVITYWAGSPVTGNSWEDSDDGKIESHLTDIVVALIVTGETQYRDKLKWHHEWVLKRKSELEEEARCRKEEEERSERERVARFEQARVDHLLQDAAAWRQSAEVREYVAAVRAASASIRDHAELQELERWASWALSKADRIDPLRSGRRPTANSPREGETPTGLQEDLADSGSGSQGANGVSG